ncbi:MAG: UDP-N-acetylmuramate dehydrogenase [Myxococcales bacterium]|nr:UDP-N-acetylmuramate dehydrogenase [Myxococcales bacterium]
MIAQEARSALEAALGSDVRFDVPMARHTSLRVGGRADAYVTPSNRETLARVLEVCRERELPHLVLGAGFNTLVRDGGIRGVVLQLGRMRELSSEEPGKLRAEAGVSHHRITKHCVTHGLSGLEFGAGIPGTVGGWVAMNAGVPERETADALYEAEVLDAEGAERRMTGADLDFTYRSARGLPEGAVVISALFSVTDSEPERVQAEVDRQLARRAGRQPLDVPSCGSVFKNPPGDHAGRLIDASGLKGLRVGGAEITEVHANFIANRGGATASDVLELIERAASAVREQSGVELETEVCIVGCDS